MSRSIRKIVFASMLALSAASSVQAAQVSCGDLSGPREVFVDPALSCIDAGPTNLGDTALVNLGYAVIDRDTGNNNGGSMNISGVGGFAGNWSFTSSLWSSYQSLYLYFHFGDVDGDRQYEPDIFIVELARADSSGRWWVTPDQKGSLSNIALLGTGTPPPPPNDVPEPASLALVGLALAGAGLLGRRTRRRV